MAKEAEDKQIVEMDKKCSALAKKFIETMSTFNEESVDISVYLLLTQAIVAISGLMSLKEHYKAVVKKMKSEN